MTDTLSVFYRRKCQTHLINVEHKNLHLTFLQALLRSPSVSQINYGLTLLHLPAIATSSATYI